MVEVAALQILIEADVASALSGLRNFKREIEMAAGSVSDDMGKITTATREMGRPAKDSQKAITDAFKGVDVQAVKTANTAANETKKVEGFLGKWKMGWVAVGAAAIASLYAVAKSSAVIGGYFREFGWIVGYVFDEIGIAMSPVIEPLLDFLWGCADAFAGLPEPVKAAAGAIIIGGAALVTLIPILALLKTSLATLGIGAIFGGIGAKITVVIAGIKAALASLGVGIGAAFATIGVLVAGATIIWYLYSEGVTKAAGDVIDSWSKAHPILYDLIMGITWPIQMLGAVAVAVMEGDLGAIPGMMKKVWSDSLAHWNSFKAQFSAGLESVKTELESWAANAYNMGVQFIDGLIKGLGDIGAKLWDALKRGLSFVSDNLASWSAGLLGFSPTLLVIGKTVMETLAEGIKTTKLETSVVENLKALSGMNWMPGYQRGGYVNRTGPAILHAGEYVTPAAALAPARGERTEINVTMPVHIAATIKTDYDIREIARRLKDELRKELKDYARCQ